MNTRHRPLLMGAELGSFAMVSLVAGCATGTPASPTTSVPTETPSMTAAPMPPPIPASTAVSNAGPAPSAGGLTHVLSDSSDGAIGITVTIPASGWSGPPSEWALEWGPNTPQHAVDELHAILSSATFD